ncbi:hypothetical protein DFH07DRAFT_947558 [Mycena maculata]|uniref:GPI mannosyltransferase 2 n=1 Tax=Mycena maculata TaxID=230809 RepID=A0AAD7HB68_9AGAR|nr:hypothetical protein DFH07DRAFT_947558 [Mycena maculata]
MGIFPCRLVLYSNFILSLFPNSLAPTVASLAIEYDATLVMYNLSLHHLGSSALPRLAAVLSLLLNSPIIIFSAPCSEPFTYLSQKGMLYRAKSHYFAAAIAFTLAATLHSSGFLWSRFIIWGLLIQPFPQRRPIYLTTMTTCVVFSAFHLTPFVAQNYTAYLTLCARADPSPEWCNRCLPLIYLHQDRCWNVGLLRYWSSQQLPIFLLAAPPLLAITCATGSKTPPTPGVSASIATHAIHAFIMCGMLLFASHTQIVLRFAAMPLTYWSSTCLLLEHLAWGRARSACTLSVLPWAASLPSA